MKNEELRRKQLPVEAVFLIKRGNGGKARMQNYSAAAGDN